MKAALGVRREVRRAVLPEVRRTVLPVARRAAVLRADDRAAVARVDDLRAAVAREVVRPAVDPVRERAAVVRALDAAVVRVRFEADVEPDRVRLVVRVEPLADEVPRRDVVVRLPRAELVRLELVLRVLLLDLLGIEFAPENKEGVVRGGLSVRRWIPLGTLSWWFFRHRNKFRPFFRKS